MNAEAVYSEQFQTFTRLVMVPNKVRDAINASLDVALKQWPDATAHDRRVLYQEVLDYYDKHGVIPDFEIVKAMSE